ncbi:unnamed protein product [Phaeothamnion confervicola]
MRLRRGSLFAWLGLSDKHAIPFEALGEQFRRAIRRFTHGPVFCPIPEIFAVSPFRCDRFLFGLSVPACNSYLAMPPIAAAVSFAHIPLRRRLHFAIFVFFPLSRQDRHNGNILLDAHGHVIHIDFGFMLANSPGGNFNFESAPFKLTGEFVELMDGPNSECFKRFRTLCVQTFLVLRQQMDKITLLAEMCSVGNGHLPCFAGRPDRVVDELRRRFRPEMHDRAAREYVHALIDRSMSSWRTSFYDKYQQLVVGIR